MTHLLKNWRIMCVLIVWKTKKKWYGLNKIYSMNVNSFFSFYTCFGSCYNLIIILLTLDYAHLEALPFTLIHVVSVQCRIITPVTVCLLQLLLSFTKYKKNVGYFASKDFSLLNILLWYVYAQIKGFFFGGGGKGGTRGEFIRGSSMSVLSKFTISKKTWNYSWRK